MPTFDFSIIGKINKANNKKVAIINKNIIGIVHISIDGEFYINANNRAIPIFFECFSKINKNKLYCINLYNNKRLCIIRDKKCITKIDNKNYLPFAPGCIVKGDIIKDKNIEVFKIKTITTEYDNIEAKQAFMFWKNNYETIKKNGIKCNRK